MSLRRTATGATVVAASWVALGLSSPALAVCDAYSGGCPSPLPSSIGGGSGGPGTGPGTGTPDTDTDTDPGTNPGTGTGGQPGTGTSTGGTTSNPSTLPFTGGELVLMTAIGAGALAGGTALVVAGRRRAQSPA